MRDIQECFTCVLELYLLYCSHQVNQQDFSGVLPMFFPTAFIMFPSIFVLFFWFADGQVICRC